MTQDTIVVEIRHRWTDEIIFRHDVAVSIRDEDRLREAILAAIRSRADLSGADLSGADLYGADLSRADLSGADLSGANLSRADLSRADLSGADLSRADLSGADLSGADLYGADLSRADLSRADLSGADLSVANLLENGTGALNIDAARFDPGYLGEDREDQHEHPLGRFPGTLMHDGALEYDRIVPTGTSRYFYCPKITPADRDGRKHETVKPTDLMRYLVKLITPPGGTVLDPFFGSGSTGKACMIEGYNVIGIEQDIRHAEEAADTCRKAAASAIDLFTTPVPQENGHA